MNSPDAATTAARRGRLLQRLGADVRAGEGRAVLLLSLAFFFFITFQYVAKTLRQSTFINALGATRLPLVYLLAALLSYPVLRLYIRYADRLPRRKLIALTCWAIAAFMVVFWWLYGYGWRWVPAAFYIWASVAFVMTVSQFWSFSNDAFDARQAKRLFGVIGAGGLVGGIAGGQIARIVAQMASPRSALLVAAGSLLIGVTLLGRVGGKERKEEAPSPAESVESGFEVIRFSRHLQLTAAILVLSVIVEQIVDLQFNWAVEQATSDLARQTAWFGNFFSLVSAAAFAFQIFATGRIHRSLGVGAGMRVLPGTIGLGTIALLLAAGAAPQLLVMAAVGLKVGESGIRFSLDQSTRELLYLPVPARARVKAKAFIDVLVQNGARGLAALLLLPITFGLFTPVQASWLTLVLCGAWLAAAGAAYRTYVQSFRVGLKERTVDPAVINMSDVRTVELLVQSLGSTDSRQVLHSLDILDSNERGHLVPPLLLYHDDPEVRKRTLRILATIGRRDAAPLVERRLHDEDPEVRAEAIRVLIDLEAGDAAARMLPRLHDADPRVRGASIAFLINHGDPEAARQANAALADMLSDADPLPRGEAMRAIGAMQRLDFQHAVLTALDDRDPRVVREAIAATQRIISRHGVDPLFLPRLISLLQDRRVKNEARSALVACGNPIVPALTHFMSMPFEPILVRRALPRILSLIGGAQAVLSLVDALEEAEDSLLRSQIVDALVPHRDQIALHGLRPRIEAAVADEAKRYLTRLADVAALVPREELTFEGPIPSTDLRQESLLAQMVGERLEEHLRTMFGLLALFLPPFDVWAAWRSLVSGRAALRVHALEYLDNRLQGDVRRSVFAVIDDSPVPDKLRVASRMFGIRPASRAETVGKFLAPDGDGASDEGALGVASLYTVHTERLMELYPQVIRLASDGSSPLVCETAAWVAAQQKIEPRPPRGDASLGVTP